MKKFRGAKLIAAMCITAMSVALSACGGGGNSAKGGASKTLTIDMTFALSSMDPQRAFEATGYEVNHSVYDTAVTFKGDDLTKVVPSVTDFAMSKNNTVLTLTVNGDHKFSDGNKVTADDIAYSYQRLQDIKGNPSYLLDGVKVAKTSNNEVTLTADHPMPELPSILTAPPMSIVEKKLVEANGGKLSPEDSAEKYLTDHSVGSGPYMYDSISTDTAIILKRNPHYTGTKPYFDRIVINNVAATSQKINLEGGNSDLSENISQDEASKLDPKKFTRTEGLTLSTWFLSFNTWAEKGKIASNTDFVSAMKHAIDYDKILSLIGKGTKRPAGIIPFSIAGAISSDPNLTYDTTKAKEYLAKSGYDGSEVTLLYSSETSHLAEVAQLVQADAAAVGIKIKLDPETAANRLSASRAHKFQIAISNWGADYPDPANYLYFLPEDKPTNHAWAYGDNNATAEAVKPYGDAAKKATGASRVKAFEAMQHKLAEVGPYIPLYQPTNFVMSSSKLKGVANNGIWGIDYASVSE